MKKFYLVIFFTFFTVASSFAALSHHALKSKGKDVYSRDPQEVHFDFTMTSFDLKMQLPQSLKNDFYQNYNKNIREKVKSIKVGYGYNFLLGGRLSSTTILGLGHLRNDIDRGPQTTDLKLQGFTGEVEQDLGINLYYRTLILRPFISGTFGAGQAKSSYRLYYNKNNAPSNHYHLSMKDDYFFSKASLGLRFTDYRNELFSYIKTSYTRYLPRKSKTTISDNSFPKVNHSQNTYTERKSHFSSLEFTIGFGGHF